MAKTLPATEVRFVPRAKRISPRTTHWEVYDKQTRSVGTPRLGTQVTMHHFTEADAQTECDRLEGLR